MSECCGPGAAAEGGRVAADGGTVDGGTADDVAGVGVADGVLAGESDGAATAVGVALPPPVPGPGEDPGVPDGVADWSGVQADSAASPVPASRRRLKARRLGESGPAGCRPNARSASS
ncbi:hypothetical protein ACFRJ8_06500 [Arthrobacter sp. NPDC056886]|uniref:hypothetical protein n=1 Tax=Arthrobacter sp. NPDC056886 TaxID=3345960 RepID=UPI0036708CFD